jgi:hypothetical protein
MKYVVAALLTLAFAGCASVFHRGEAREPQRLCIRNATVGYGNIVAHAGLIRFDVMPGQESCKRIAEISSHLTLVAETTAGGTAGPLHYNAELPGGASRCWRWELANSQASQANLMPCDLGAEPGAG